MILSGLKIKEEYDNGNIEISDFQESRLNPNSYNLTLHNELLVYTTSVLDMKCPLPTECLKIPPEGITLKPGVVYLGRTKERTHTDIYVPMLEGRSSIGRLGMSIHVTAGFGDIGFDGYWTLEITVTQPTIIYPDIEICQIYYHTIEGKYELYKSGKYQENSGIQPSLMYKDFENQHPITKYQIGDRVLVRNDLDPYTIYYMEDRTIFDGVTYDMIQQFKNSIVTISEITDDGKYLIQEAPEDGKQNWTDGMFVRKVDI